MTTLKRTRAESKVSAQKITTTERQCKADYAYYCKFYTDLAHYHKGYRMPTFEEFKIVYADCDPDFDRREVAKMLWFDHCDKQKRKEEEEQKKEDEKEITITEWMTNFNKSKYINISEDIQIKAGWYDWFCDELELRSRMYTMMPIVFKCAQALGESFCNSHYVMFKNNLGNTMYDDFRFINIETEDVSFTIAPSYKKANYMSDVNSAENIEKMTEIVKEIDENDFKFESWIK
jgi:hypothetical protein